MKSLKVLIFLFWVHLTLTPLALAQSLLSLVDVKDYGAKGDGVTDDSTAVNNAITAIMGSTGAGAGGTLYFSPGTYLLNSCLNLPNDGGVPGSQPPTQPSFRMIGSGSSMTSGISGSPGPHGGTILDMRCNPASGGKLLSLGQGLLEIGNLIFEDQGSDSATFIYATNTVLHVHDVEFYGTAAGASAVNDAIVLGGSTTSVFNFDTTGPCQGYGTVIRDDHFRKIKRAVVTNVFCNSMQIHDNTVWSDSGNPAGGAFEFLPGAGGSVYGMEVWNNLIEVTHYKYGIYGAAGFKQSVMHNDFYDGAGGTYIAPYRFDSGASGNLVIDGYRTD